MTTRMKLPAMISLGAVLLAGAASASTVYDYTGGGILITGVTVDGTSVLGSSADLALTTSSTATTDTGPTLSFNVGSGGNVALTGTVSFTGTGGKMHTLNFSAATWGMTNLMLTSLAPLSLSGSAGNYNFSSGVSNGVAISGGWSLTGATDTVNGVTTAVSVGNTAFGPTDKPISGTVSITNNGNSLQMDGVPLGTFIVDGQTVNITGNVIFDGATPVPLPAALFLLGPALGLMGLSARRRRTTP